MKQPILSSALLLLLLPLPLSADDQVRSVQEELRRRNLYFGEIDGHRTGEFSEAVRSYQVRKGFTASGVEDRDTLRSLGVVQRLAGEPKPKELEWPEEPVLKSDSPVSAPATVQAVSQETGVPATALNPQKTGGPVSQLEIARAAAHPNQVSTSTPLPPIAERNDPRVIPGNIVSFAKDYVRALGSRSLQDELHFYADRVNYYRNGVIDRRIIEHTLRDYARRWPSRHYTIGKVVEYAPLASRGQIVVTFQVRFTLKGHGKKVEGRTLNRVVINAATSDPRIVSIQERRLSR